MKKKILLIFLVFLFLIPTFVNASTNTLERDNTLNVWDEIDKNRYRQDILNTPRVDEKEKIYDFANLLNEEEEKKLFDKIENYIEKYKMDFVFLTIDSNNKTSTERYGEDFYIYNYFGFEDKKRSGSLFILDMQNRNYHIITSGSMILYLDDERINNILDDVFDDIKGGNYYTAFDKVISKLDSYGTSTPSSNSGVIIDSNGVPIRAKRPSIFISFVLGFIIAIAFVMINISKHKGIVLATSAEQYLDSNKTNVYKKNDKMISTHTSAVTIPKDPPRSSGGSSSHHIGGSSFHLGGGGHSFGGGGRHF